MTVLVLALVIVLGLALGLYALAPSWRRGGGAGPADARRLELLEERDALYRAVDELDRELAAGSIDAEDHRRLRLRDETRAALVLRRLEELPPAPAVGAARPAWPLAVALFAALSVGGVLAARLAVPPLQALALGPQEAKALEAARRLPALEARLNAEAAANPKTGAATETLLEYAEAAWVAGDYPRAASAYTVLLRRDPRQPTALGRYGTLLFFDGRNDEALELLDLANRLEPTAEFYLTKGNLLFSAKNDPQGAIAAWEEYRRLEQGGSERVADLIAAAQARIVAADPGARLFAQNCAGCHGSQGQGVVGPRLAGNAQARDPALVTSRVRNGKGQMPAFPQLAGEELERIVTYVTGLAGER